MYNTQQAIESRKSLAKDGLFLQDRRSNRLIKARRGLSIHSRELIIKAQSARIPALEISHS